MGSRSAGWKASSTCSAVCWRKPTCSWRSTVFERERSCVRRSCSAWNAKEDFIPRISPAEFYALPLRVNSLLAGIPLHDVWAVDLPRRRENVTLDHFLRRSGRDAFGAADSKIKRLPPPARALYRLRLFLGRIFRLEVEPNGAEAERYATRLTAEDSARSLVAAGTPDGPFRVVYRFENEQLLELQNRTVHAAALSALVETADGYRFYFAVYVGNAGWVTPLYMALIDPFRRWIIYPALLKNIRAAWIQKA
jgi:hypothetical protein